MPRQTCMNITNHEWGWQTGWHKLQHVLLAGMPFWDPDQVVHLRAHWLKGKTENWDPLMISDAKTEGGWHEPIVTYHPTSLILRQKRGLPFSLRNPFVNQRCCSMPGLTSMLHAAIKTIHDVFMIFKTICSPMTQPFELKTVIAPPGTCGTSSCGWWQKLDTHISTWHDMEWKDSWVAWQGQLVADFADIAPRSLASGSLGPSATCLLWRPWHGRQINTFKFHPIRCYIIFTCQYLKLKPTQNFKCTQIDLTLNMNQIPQHAIHEPNTSTCLPASSWIPDLP